MNNHWYGVDNAERIITHYYPAVSPLRDMLLQHSRSVMRRALQIAEARLELDVNHSFVACAALLHDIGILRCQAPGIYCHGTEPYICHGIQGAAMVRQWFADHPQTDDAGDAALSERLARVCERHTGAGITIEDIRTQQLPLPERDFMPETLEEQLICYADKFYSKTRLNHEKNLAEAVRSLQKFGDAGVQRFLEWQKRFEPTLG